MNPLVDKKILWLCWHVDARWNSWWWLSCDCTSSSFREPKSYLPLPEDHTLPLEFSGDPRELLVQVWTNATDLIVLEVFHGLDLYEGPFKIRNDDLAPTKLRLQAILEAKGDSISYSLKGAYRDGDAQIHTIDPKFTISRSG